MIEGETDPVQLADLAKGRMRHKIPDLAQALTGTFDAHHAQLATSMLRRLELGSWLWRSWMRSLSKRAGRGSIRSSCCRRFRGWGDGCAGDRG